MPANSLEKIGNQSKDFPRCLSSPLRAVAANGESRPGPAGPGPAPVGKHLPGKENKVVGIASKALEDPGRGCRM